MSDDPHQLLCFPYLSLDSSTELEFRNILVWSSSLLDKKVPESPVRERVEELLKSYRAPAGIPEKSRPLEGIGIVSIGEPDFQPLSDEKRQEVRDFRYSIFLACLAHNATLYGPNAGHDLYTAENFELVTQNFLLDSEYFSEVTGVIVEMTHLGYKVGKTEFPTPTYIPLPHRFRHDQDLFQALDAARKCDPGLFRRIMAAASLFLESYHNTHAVDVRARILLQVAAFETLLDLSDGGGRRGFKDEVERLCANDSDRKYRYKYQTRGGRVPESRTQKGIWADRFYSLRNSIIHGDRVRQKHYLYRSTQHHLMIGPIFFVLCLKRIIEGSSEAWEDEFAFYERIDWVKPDPEEDDVEDVVEGFRLRTDYGGMIRGKLDALNDEEGE